MDDYLSRPVLDLECIRTAVVVTKDQRFIGYEQLKRPSCGNTAAELSPNIERAELMNRFGQFRRIQRLVQRR